MKKMRSRTAFCSLLDAVFNDKLMQDLCVRSTSFKGSRTQYTIVKSCVKLANVTFDMSEFDGIQPMTPEFLLKFYLRYQSTLYNSLKDTVNVLDKLDRKIHLCRASIDEQVQGEELGNE